MMKFFNKPTTRLVFQKTVGGQVAPKAAPSASPTPTPTPAPAEPALVVPNATAASSVVSTPSSFFVNPPDAQKVTELMDRDERGQFELPIVKKENISHDTILLRLQFPDPNWIIGMPVGHHIRIFKPKLFEGDKGFGRAYTPVTPINTKGYLEFVIKCYPKTEEFPEGGKMGNYLRERKVGDKLLLKGPVG